MSWRRIRPVAVGVARRDDEVLLAEHYDPTADERFLRLPGGGVEFGEQSQETLAREFDEELGLTVADRRHLDTRERTFTFDGTPGHEIWFLYEITFEEEWPYERETIVGREPELDEEYRAVWQPLDDLADMTVYPADLSALLGE